MIKLPTLLASFSLIVLAGSAACTIVTHEANVTSGGGDNGAAENAGDTGVNPSAGSGNTPQDMPLPSGPWVNVTGNLANKPSTCGTVSLVSVKPDEDMVIVGIGGEGLWFSKNAGKTWSQWGDSHAMTNRPLMVVYDPDSPDQVWESGIYGDGVYLTVDDGSHFVKQGDVQHVDSISIDFSDPKRQLILAGGHEQPKTVYRSTDGGGTWSPIGTNLPAGTFCTNPLIIDAKTYLVGCQTYLNSNGIYRSTDSGKNWTSVSKLGGLAAPLVAADGTIYWIGNYDGGFVKSSDSGQTWTDQLMAGSIQAIPFHELPDHRIAAVGRDALLVSSDAGETWQPVTNRLPFTPSSFAYSETRKAFYVTHADCGTDPIAVGSDSVMRFDLE